MLTVQSTHFSKWVSTLAHGILNTRDNIKGLQGTFSYHQTFNITLTLIGNKNVDHSDVVGAPPVGAAPTTSSFFT